MDVDALIFARLMACQNDGAAEGLSMARSVIATLAAETPKEAQGE
jgi:hypothetical protein